MYMYACMYVCCVCVYVCMYVCMLCVCVYVCVLCVCVYVRARVNIWRRECPFVQAVAVTHYLVERSPAVREVCLDVYVCVFVVCLVCVCVCGASFRCDCPVDRFAHPHTPRLYNDCRADCVPRVGFSTKAVCMCACACARSTGAA